MASKLTLQPKDQRRIPTVEEVLMWNPDCTVELAHGAIREVRMAPSNARIITPQAQLRYMATSRPALSLSRAQRQAAAADPGLEWDEQTGSYRRARKGQRHQSSQKGADNTQGEGGGKS